MPGDASPDIRLFPLNVDLVNYPGATHIPEAFIFIPSGLPQQVLTEQVVDEIYWYYDENGAADYLSLIRNQAYSVLTQNVALLRRTMYFIIRDLMAYSSAPDTHHLPLDFVALGVGSADKELTIIHDLLESVTESAECNYVPVDISLPLLTSSLHAVFAAYRPQILANALALDPLLTDFRRLGSRELGKNDLKLIASLGIVWNMDMAQVLRTLFDILSQQETATKKAALLIDAEFIGDRTPSKLKESYDNDYARRFFYHPLELLHTAALVSKEQTGSRPLPSFDINNVGYSYSSYFAGYPYDPKLIKVEVVSLHGGDGTVPLNKFLRDYGLSESAKRYLLGGGTLSKSLTVAVVYEPKAEAWKTNKKAWPRPVLLGYSTRFDSEEFLASLRTFSQDAGFVPLGSGSPYFDDKKQFGYILLRRAIGAETVLPELDVSAIVKKYEDEHDVTVDWGKTFDGIEYFAVLQASSSSLRIFSNPSTVLLSDFSRTESQERIEALLDKFQKDVAAAMGHNRFVKGGVAWVPSRIRDDVMSDWATRYSPDRKVQFVRNREEFQNAIRHLGL